jgi:uncharacterized membrane protein YecN with MAPEG domain
MLMMPPVTTNTTDALFSMSSAVTPVYAALLAVLFIALSMRTIGLRRSLQIAVGDAGDKAMLRAMRAHANFAEYVPLALLLILFVEASGAPAWLVHGASLALLLGRLSHAWGVSQLAEDFRFRVGGMLLTFACLGVCSATLLVMHGAR